MHGPPAWLILSFLPTAAVSAAIVIRSMGSTILRLRAARQSERLELAAASSADTARLEAEIDELRAEVAKLSEAQAFYARLGAPAEATAAART